MKLSHVLPLAAFSTAFVLPSEEVLSQIAIEDNHRGDAWYKEAVETKDDVLSSFKKHFDEVTETSKGAWEDIVQSSRNAFDEAYEYTNDAAETVREKVEDTSYDVQSWLATEVDEMYDAFNDGPPHHGPPHHGPPDHERPGHGRRPHHPPHDHAPNLTVYQLIAGSKYTTKLAKLINQFDDLVDALNSTKANYTVFAPTDKAFDKIPEHAPKPSKEVLKAILEYHVSPDFYPARRVLVTHTVPTLLKGEHLSSQPEPQRLAFKIGFNGLSVNFYSRIVAVNIFGTNGVIHGVDSLIIPPPNTIKIIDLLPGEFSTLELGLGKTGLLETLNTTDHAGGTFFAPSNFAFQKLGPKINAFLFSQYGLKYLKALLQYHVVYNNTVYSDAYYHAESSSDADVADVPKGYFHAELPTLLEDRSLSLDVARYGGFISMKINGFSRITVQDGIAEDGVIHVVSDVLVPPKKIGGAGSDGLQHWGGEDLSLEDLVERLEPFVAKGDL